MAIKIKPSHEGRLRRHFGTKEGENIPASDLEHVPAGHGVNALTLKREIVFARNARKWKKK